MVYSINQKVLTLTEYGTDNFVRDLAWLEQEAFRWDSKNAHWFRQLQTSYKKYPEWFFLFDDDVPVAFATIQKYYEGCFRILTRTYIYRDYRRFTNPKYDTFFSPTMRLLPYQLEYIGKWNTVFVSMQAGRKNAIKRYARKLGYNTGFRWGIDNDMIQTCGNPKDPDCWQHVTFAGDRPHLPRMLENDYRKMFN